MKTAFLIDSTCAFTEGYPERNDIFEVTLSVIFGNDDVLPDSTDPTITQQFVQKFKENDGKLMTSQPSTGSIIEVYEKIIAEGYERIVGVMLSDRLSGTVQSVLAVAEEYADKIESVIYNSKSAVIAPYGMLEELIRLVEQGASRDTMDRHMQYLMDQCQTYLIIPQMDSIKSGGRLEISDQAAAATNNTFNFLKVAEDGTLQLAERARTERRREDTLIGYVKEAYDKHDGQIYVAIAHGNNLEGAEKFKERIQQAVPGVEVEIRLMRPTIIGHVGEKGYAFGIVPAVPAF